MPKKVRLPCRDKDGKIIWARVDPVLGEIPDPEVASQVGCHVGTIRKRRRKLGKEPYRATPDQIPGAIANKSVWIDWTKVDFRLKDQTLGRKLQVTESVVRYHRQLLQELLELQYDYSGEEFSLENFVLLRRDDYEMMRAYGGETHWCPPPESRVGDEGVVHSGPEGVVGDRERAHPYQIVNAGGEVLLVAYSKLGVGIPCRLSKDQCAKLAEDLASAARDTEVGDG